MSEPAIRAEGLTVRFGPLVALEHVDLAVSPGEVVALLGPNGAGKSTCVETLLGYRRPDAGRVSVLGHDPVRDHRDVVGRVGVMLQRPGIWPSLSPSSAISLVASYYDAPEDPEALIELLDLGACRHTPARRLSGGELQRVSLAMALLPRPEALFLDEPTAGVDPVGRRVIRDVVASLRARGAAVLLCTHDLSDVEATCDAAVVLRAGRVVAAGRVEQLTAGGTTFRTSAGLALEPLARVVGTHVEALGEGHYLTAIALDAASTAALAAHLADHGHALEELRHGTTLETRYVELVGTAALEADPPPLFAETTARRRRRRR
jgi:ABC-2 type transport system ATP-binding protein